MDININSEILNSDFKILTLSFKNITIRKSNDDLEKFSIKIFEEVQEKYDITTLKDISNIRLYRDFYWRMGIDPTKNRPSVEALIRRILIGKTIPKVNTFVDAYNLASIKTEVALAAFDEKKLKGSLILRFAIKDEEFLGIGMATPMILKGREIVISDSGRIVALYPYRDADYSRVTEETKDILILICGVPGISLQNLNLSKKIVEDYIQLFCKK